MSRITDAFKGKKAFIPFITAGDPNADFTVKMALAMAEAGADIIELGVPFSDPIAEGPVIQEASVRALSAGMTTEGVFDIVRRIRENSQIPLILMGYLNPVYHYGYDSFFEKCKSCGVDGVIIADLPFEEKREVSDVASEYGIDVISLIAPTSKDRIQMIASDAQGFIYLVSSMGVTGVRTAITTDVASMVRAVREVTDIPVAIGFGISTAQQAADMAGKSDGAIVGSAIVRMIAQDGEAALDKVAGYVKQMAEAVHKEAAM